MKIATNCWWPVVESRELARKPLSVRRFGQRLVLWRDSSGTPHALPDRCPHLGAALSAGRVSGDRLVCPFHGFEFDGDGQCRHIPAVGRDGRIPKGMAVAGLAVREAHGFLYLWQGASRATDPPLPFFPPLDESWRWGSVRVDWPVHYTRAIENQLDVAHLPFVHRTTIGAAGLTRVDGPHVESEGDEIRVWTTNARDDGQPRRDAEALAAAARTRPPTLRFLFPNLWLLDLSPRLKNVIAFAPIDERTTRYYLRVYHRHRNPLVARPFEAVMGLSNRYILNQDRRVVVTQTPANSGDADDRLIGPDRAIALFRRELRRRLAEVDGPSG